MKCVGKSVHCVDEVEKKVFNLFKSDSLHSDWAMRCAGWGGAGHDSWSTAIKTGDCQDALLIANNSFA